MKKKRIAILLILVLVGLTILGCVTQPRFSDYIGSYKEDALNNLRAQKTSNTVKLILNWLLWGWAGLYIPSIVDTINYVNYLDDFRTIESKIQATPDGGIVGK